MNYLTETDETDADGKRYFKASRADHGTKGAIIQNNRDQYSGSAMCSVLQIPRNTFDDEKKEQANEEDMAATVRDIFHKNQKAYGTRKIKVKLHERGWVLSRRRIGWIMKEQGLVSTYTIAQDKSHKAACKEEVTANSRNREFAQTAPKPFIVSD